MASAEPKAWFLILPVYRDLDVGAEGPGFVFGT